MSTEGLPADFTYHLATDTQLPGYSLLIEHGLYHPINNPGGVCRDHIVSIAYGWRNNISPKIISDPGNCQFLTAIENCKKNDKSGMTIDSLKERIKNNDFSPVKNNTIYLPKTKNHREKISEANKKYMTITDGQQNFRVYKSSNIPAGFKRGMTRKNKMVGAVGVEPTIR